jgi:outer membrane receptor protein involved in Fe transport
VNFFGARVTTEAAQTFNNETIWGGFVQFQPWAATRLDLSAENIGDRFYYDVMSTTWVPASGRTVRLTLTQRL